MYEENKEKLKDYEKNYRITTKNGIKKNIFFVYSIKED